MPTAERTLTVPNPDDFKVAIDDTVPCPACEPDATRLGCDSCDGSGYVTEVAVTFFKANAALEIRMSPESFEVLLELSRRTSEAVAKLRGVRS